MDDKKRNVISIILIILGITVVAVLGSVFVNIGMAWFDSLTKPIQWIPNIVIPIMWTLIYIDFGIVLILWILKSRLTFDVIIWLTINGILNIIWCLVFFTLNLTFIGNIVIVLNLIAGIILFFKIYKYEKFYAIVTSIYPIWLSIATTLNIALWILN